MVTDATAVLVTDVDRSDPGDETFRRFRYQATYAATVAVGQLETHSDIAEVYCEHYEDLLVLLRSGKCRGVQVKTKSDDSRPVRSTDEPILDALVRFIELDTKFPEAFVGFTIASNTAFDRAGKGHGNLIKVIGEAREYLADGTAPCAKARRLAKTLLARLLKKRPRRKKLRIERPKSQQPDQPPGGSEDVPSEGDILRILAKVDLQDDLPKLPDIRSRLRDRLVRLSSSVAASTVPAVERVVDAVERAAYAAASRADEDSNGRYWFICDPEERKARAVSDEILRKRITRADLESIIAGACSGAMLVSAEPVTPDQIPQDRTLLEKKLIAGQLSASTIDLARDAVASVEEFGTSLLYLYGDVEGVARYNHVRTVVKKECALAYESQSATGGVSGPKMLVDVEARLKERREEDTTGIVKECQEEHLLGHAFVLTGQCLVWWSTLRDLGGSREPSDTEVAGE